MHNFERRPQSPRCTCKVVGGRSIAGRPPASAGARRDDDLVAGRRGATWVGGSTSPRPPGRRSPGRPARPRIGPFVDPLPQAQLGSGQSSLVPAGRGPLRAGCPRGGTRSQRPDLRGPRIRATGPDQVPRDQAWARQRQGAGAGCPRPTGRNCLPTFGIEAWNSVVSAFAEQSRILASLLSGRTAEQHRGCVFARWPATVPAAEQELATSCSCHVFRGLDAATDGPSAGGPTRWCKHVCCVMYPGGQAFAHRLLTVFGPRPRRG